MSRHHRRVSTGIALALALALAAISPATISARPAPNPPATTSQAYAPPVRDLRTPGATNAAVASIQAQAARVARELAARDAASGSAIATPQTIPIVKISQTNGFLIDAGIGAGAMLGLILALLGSTLYVIHRRTPHISQPR